MIKISLDDLNIFLGTIFKMVFIIFQKMYIIAFNRTEIQTNIKSSNFKNIIIFTYVLVSQFNKRFFYRASR